MGGGSPCSRGHGEHSHGWRSTSSTILKKDEPIVKQDEDHQTLREKVEAMSGPAAHTRREIRAKKVNVCLHRPSRLEPAALPLR